MPPNKVRPPGGQPRGAQGKQAGDELLSARIAAPGQVADTARVLKLIEKQLGVVRCADCSRRLSSLRSILKGCGPVCLRKRLEGVS
jgi:hypothetical protein